MTARFMLLFLGLAACQRATNPSPPPAAPPSEAPIVELSPEGIENAQVRTAVLQPRAFSPRLITTAVIIADPQRLARVGAHMAGRVAAIDVRLGDRVRKGQALVEIDTVEIHHVSTDYLTALARASEASDAFARQKQLVAERVGAEQDLRRAQANAETAEAALREAEEHLHFLGLTDETITNLRTGRTTGALRSILRAPIGGRVDALNVSLGQVLTGTEDVMTILESDEVWATLRVFERDLSGILPGAAADIRVTSYPQMTFHGTVRSLSDLVDVATRTVEARVQIDNPNSILKPGMTAEAAVMLQDIGASLWLPAEAVQPHGGDRIVFVEKEPRHFVAKQVAVGSERGGYVPIVSGLTSGSTVVVHGAFALRGELERSEMQGE